MVVLAKMLREIDFEAVDPQLCPEEMGGSICVRWTFPSKYRPERVEWERMGKLERASLCAVSGMNGAGGNGKSSRGFVDFTLNRIIARNSAFKYVSAVSSLAKQMLSAILLSL